MSHPLTKNLAAVVLQDMMRALERFQDYEVELEEDNTPLPEGLLTCGEARRILPMLMAIVHYTYPELWEPEQLERVLRDNEFYMVAKSNFTLN